MRKVLGVLVVDAPDAEAAYDVACRLGNLEERVELALEGANDALYEEGFDPLEAKVELVSLPEHLERVGWLK